MNWDGEDLIEMLRVAGVHIAVILCVGVLTTLIIGAAGFLTGVFQ